MLLIIILPAIWYVVWGNKESDIDLDIFVQSIRASLTASSILLSGILLVWANLLTDTPISPLSLRIALIWVGISIITGVYNLFTLPTIIGREKDRSGRASFSQRSQVLIGLIQLLTLLFAGLRLIIGMTI